MKHKPRLDPSLKRTIKVRPKLAHLVIQAGMKITLKLLFLLCCVGREVAFVEAYCKAHQVRGSEMGEGASKAHLLQYSNFSN